MREVAAGAAEVKEKLEAMNKVLRFADAKNCTEGKIVATILSVLLVLSFMNGALFADRALAAEFDSEVAEATVEVPAPADDPIEETTPEPDEPVFSDVPAVIEDVPETAALTGEAQDGTRVTVEAAGAEIPEGATLEVEYAGTDRVVEALNELLAQNESIDVFKTAYQLVFKNAEGETFVPAGTVKVTFEPTTYATMGLSLYRIVGTGQAAPVEIDAALTPEGTAPLNALTFTTDHAASVFVLAGPAPQDAEETEPVEGEETPETPSTPEADTNTETEPEGPATGEPATPDTPEEGDGETVPETPAPTPGSNVNDSAEVERIVLYVGESRNLRSFVEPGQNWSSEHAEVASISLDGTVSALTPGTTVIRYGEEAVFEVVVRAVVADEMANGTVELAHFYFLPPTEDGATEASLAAAKFLGSGLVKIPDGYADNQTLVNGTVLPLSKNDNGEPVRNKVISLADLIVSAPTDREVRLGLASYYNGSLDEGSSKITADQITGYSFEPVQISGKMSSVGYKGETLSPASAHHVYVQMSIATEDSFTVSYKVLAPAGLTTHAVLHRASDEAVALPTTAENNLVVDGYTYPMVQRVASEDGTEGTSYLFDGWYTDSSYQHKAPASYSAQESATFYARYVSEAAHTATFDCAGGTFADENAYRTVKADAGAAYWLPEAPSRFGYEFTGWLLDGTQNLFAAGFARSMDDTDLTYTAQWEALPASITLSAEGGSFADGSDQMVLAGVTGAEVQATGATPVKPGYRFVGWNTAADGTGTLLSQVSGTFAAGDIILYAQYEEDPSQYYTVTYRASYGGQVQLGTGAGLTPATSQVSEGKVLQGTTEGLKGATASSPWSQYFVFVGWRVITVDEDGNATPNGEAFTRNLVLTPEEVARQLTVVDGAYENIVFEAWFEYSHVSSGENVPYYVNYYLMNDAGEYPTDPTCFLAKTAAFVEGASNGIDELDKGYGDDGFAFLAGAQGNLPQDFDPAHYTLDESNPGNVFALTYLPSQPMVFKVYVEKYLQVAFEAGEHGSFPNRTGDGATIDNENLVAYRLLKGARIPAVPTVQPVAGYRFTGWAQQGTPVADDTFVQPVSRAVTYTATYEALPATIAFVANGGTPVETLTGVTDEAVGAALPTTTRDGYTFGGWYDNAECAGEPIAALPEVFPAGDTVYYAKWSADAAYIRFDKNADDATGSQEGIQGVTDAAVNAAFPEGCNYERSGYHFVGWNTRADGTGDMVTSFPATFAAHTTTYYAQWALDTAWLEAEDFSWAGTYDGRGHGIVVPAGLALKEGEHVEAVIDGTVYSEAAARTALVNVADSRDDIIVRIVARDGQVLCTLEGVSVQVAKATLTVTTNSIIHPFDGTPAVSEGIVVEGLVAGETLGYRTTGVAHEVGEMVENTFELTWAADGNSYTAKEGNYTVVAQLGTIKMVSSECPVTIEGYVGVYDGEEHAITYAVAEGEDATITFDAPIAYTTAGARAIDFMVSCADHGTFEGTVGLYIIQRPVTIAVEDSFKIEATADPEFTGAIVEGDLVEEGDLGAITFERVNDAEEVGMYLDALTANYLPNNNYHVDVLPGTFTIGPVGSVVVNPSNPLLPPRTYGATGDSSGEVIDGVAGAVVRTVAGVAQAARSEGAASTAVGLALEAAGAVSGRVSFDDEEPTVTRAAGEVIEDDETALGAFDEPHCWVHWLMALGIVLTLGYAAVVASRRLGFGRCIEDFEVALTRSAAVERAREAAVPAATKVRS